MTNARIVPIVITLMVTIGVVWAIRNAARLTPHGAQVATDIVHIPPKCNVLAMWELKGQTETELDAYDARQVENDMIACGARIERKAPNG